MTRIDGRANNEFRNLKIHRDFVSSADGSVLLEMGRTRVLCNATLLPEVPRWLKGKGSGWITAEYSLLPQSTNERVDRERKSLSGRTQEIQRLIGRSLRSAVNLQALGERALIVDCDVIEADGGTRTASIVGGFLALAIALGKLEKSGEIQTPVISRYVSAISCGIVQGTPLLDLCYSEDSQADVDMNVVMADGSHFVEVQGTGENAVYSRTELDALLSLAQMGCLQLLEIQKQILS